MLLIYIIVHANSEQVYTARLVALLKVLGDYYTHVWPKSYLLQCFEVFYHFGISQAGGCLIANSRQLVFIHFMSR